MTRAAERAAAEAAAAANAAAGIPTPESGRRQSKEDGGGVHSQHLESEEELDDFEKAPSHVSGGVLRSRVGHWSRNRTFLSLPLICRSFHGPDSALNLPYSLLKFYKNTR